MTTEEEKICLEKPVQKQAEEHENKNVLIFFAILLGLTVLIGGLLDFFFAGIPLHFTIPIINVRATISTILYYASVLFASTYIGIMGFRELFVEKRFSVEFLMAGRSARCLVPKRAIRSGNCVVSLFYR